MARSIAEIPPMTRGVFVRLRSSVPEISAVGLIAVAAVLGWLVWEYNVSVALVRHTVDVETGISDVLSIVQNAEAGSRGYVLTGDDAFLHNDDRSMSIYESDLDHLRHLTVDNAEQESTLVSLKRVIEARFANW